MTEEDPTPGDREWRVIPEFPRYEITSDGDVRNRRTKKLKFETEDLKGGQWYYSLWRGYGQPKAKRNYKRLVHSAWPELDVPWKSIPGFEHYEVSKNGDVRHKSRMQNLTRKSNGLYRLYSWVDGKRVRTLWSEGEIGNEQDWEDFWNDVHPTDKKAA